MKNFSDGMIDELEECGLKQLMSDLFCDVFFFLISVCVVLTVSILRDVK